jgi:alginate O-acetyltransferase complex protein AlgI
LLFNSHLFIFVFLPLVWVGHRAIAHWKSNWTAGFLVAASLVFYGFWDWRYIALIVVSCAANYGLAMFLWRNVRSGQLKRLWLAIGIVLNLLILGYYKYANFFVDNVNAALGLEWTITTVVLPIGLSFFTFQQMAFLIDVSRGTVVDRSFTRYLLFVTFFPQLIAGPIVHHAEMMPQFAKPQLSATRNLAFGITYFAIGLFKKVVIADNLALIASPVFVTAEAGTNLNAGAAWLATLAYTLQIYFDFSGYSDMAIGLGCMFGIALPVNFASPYKATSIIEFWRRWHITLSRFLRDYLYKPLGGNRSGVFRRHINVFITMAIGGFWHGASWNFLLWGVLHGFCIIANSLWRSWAGAPPVPRWLGWAMTFLAVAILWVPFRANGLDATLSLWSSMIGIQVNTSAVCGSICEVTAASTVFVLGAFLCCVALPATHTLLRHARTTIATKGYPATEAEETHFQWLPNWRWAAITAIIIATSIVYLSNASEFIYFQF